MVNSAQAKGILVGGEGEKKYYSFIFDSIFFNVINISIIMCCCGRAGDFKGMNIYIYIYSTLRTRSVISFRRRTAKERKLAVKAIRPANNFQANFMYRRAPWAVGRFGGIGKKKSVAAEADVKRERERERESAEGNKYNKKGAQITRKKVKERDTRQSTCRAGMRFSSLRQLINK